MSCADAVEGGGPPDWPGRRLALRSTRRSPMAPAVRPSVGRCQGHDLRFIPACAGNGATLHAMDAPGNGHSGAPTPYYGP